MQTLPNRLTLIFRRLTNVRPFSGSGFPAHDFNFAAYNELGSRADDNNAILTGECNRYHQHTCNTLSHFTFPNCRLHKVRFICWRRTRCWKRNSKNGCLEGYHATKPRVTFVYVILYLSLTILCYYTTNQAFFLYAEEIV